MKSCSLYPCTMQNVMHILFYYFFIFLYFKCVYIFSGMFRKMKCCDQEYCSNANVRTRKGELLKVLQSRLTDAGSKPLTLDPCTLEHICWESSIWHIQAGSYRLHSVLTSSLYLSIHGEAPQNFLLKTKSFKKSTSLWDK